MTSFWKLNQLDFRFADDEDAEDIKNLINTVYVHEEEGQGEGGFRPEGEPKVNLSELFDDFESASIRWILLETPRPEEAVIAALRLHILRVEGVQRAGVSLFGSLEPVGQRSVLNMLLNRAETVCRSLGCQKLVFDIPHWSERRQSWLQECGYQDLGGHMWPEERQDEILRHTMVMEFEKSLLDKASSTPSTSLTPPVRNFNIPPLPQPNFFTASDKLTKETTSDGQSDFSESDPMFPLIKDLFSALHSESNLTTQSSTIDSEADGKNQFDVGDLQNCTVIHSGGSIEVNNGHMTVHGEESSTKTSSSSLLQNDTSDMTNLLANLVTALNIESNNNSDGANKGS